MGLGAGSGLAFSWYGGRGARMDRIGLIVLVVRRMGRRARRVTRSAPLDDGYRRRLRRGSAAA